MRKRKALVNKEQYDQPLDNNKAADNKINKI